MAYTNHTTNYELPQYVGTDKPSYLNDFNYAMSTIDGQMKTNANSAQSAQSTANSADGKIGTLSSLDTTNKTDIVSAVNEVNSKTGTLSNLNTTNKTNVVSAVNEVNTNLKNINLTNITNFNDTTGFSLTGCTVSSVQLTLATNNDDSLFKFYGEIKFTATAQSVDIIVPTNITGVTEEYSVYPCGYVGKGVPSNGNGSPTFGFTVQTDGKIKIHWWAGSNRDANNFYLIPFIVFNKNFGDYDPNA